MIAQRLEKFMASRRATLLGVGPMSRNCVDATIELANDFEVPIMLIASRRQIESAELGGGYVNGWTTESFSDYVIRNDRKGKVLLARDHGGPWQNPLEVEGKFSLRMAMDSAKKSYQTDIESGFQIIHIDPSVDINGKTQVTEVLDRVYELYEYCWSTARALKKDIIFEIGTEEQSGSTDSLEELEFLLRDVTQFCKRNRFPSPTFIVMQTGTRVMETRNVGSFDSPFRISGELPAEIQVPRMLELCKRYGLYMKEHNTDYLSDESLSWHPKLGIHAANVAPEFGVTETRAFIELLRANHLEQLSERFLELSYESKKWKKWMVPDTKASDFDRAVISGHYVFSHPIFKEIKDAAQVELSKRNLDIDSHLKNQVKTCISRYLTNFKLVETFVKPVATIILNRNLPVETDALYEKIRLHNEDMTDIFVVESGSEQGNLSKHCTWWANWEESLAHGLRYPRGFNFALSKMLEEGKYDKYEHFLLICNDAEIPLKPFVGELCELMRKHPRVGILSPCSSEWGEKNLIGADEIRYFWYVNHVAWMVRRDYIDDVREVEKPSLMNFLYDGENFRGYESETELVAKGYINDWATAITTKVMVEENKSHLLTKADLIRTEPYEESLAMSVREGKRWMRRKYGFNSRWSMQMYAKFFYESFFENHPQLRGYKI